MKKILSIKFLLLPLIMLAQSTHKGKFFPNEAITSQKIRDDHRYHQTSHSSAEIFLKISETGKYKVTIEDQSIENSTGIFRFFDVNSGRITLSVYEKNHLIYKSSFYIRSNHRLVFDLSYDGLYLLEETDLKGKKTHTHLQPPSFNNKRVMNNEEFDQFLKEFKQRSFDDEKIKAFKMRSVSTAFSTRQIIKILDIITFNSDKLPLAKLAFKNCIDPENYDKVIDTFLGSDKYELEKFIERYYNY